MALIKISALRSMAHASGAAGTHVFNVAFHGTRPNVAHGADVAHPQRAAVGRMIHSVFEGPRRRHHRGAPVVKRVRQA